MTDYQHPARHVTENTRSKVFLAGAVVAASCVFALAVGSIILSATSFDGQAAKAAVSAIGDFVSIRNLILAILAPGIGLLVAYKLATSLISAQAVVPTKHKRARYVLKTWEATLRFVTTLPTIVLGAVVLTLMNSIPLLDGTGTVAVSLKVATLVSTLTLPTATSLVDSVSAAEQRSLIISARALGLGRTYVARRILTPAMRRSIKAGVAFGAGRVVVEAMLIALRTKDEVDLDATFGAKQAHALLETVFSETAITQNYWLLLALFAAAVGFNFVNSSAS